MESSLNNPDELGEVGGEVGAAVGCYPGNDKHCSYSRRSVEDIEVQSQLSSIITKAQQTPGRSTPSQPVLDAPGNEEEDGDDQLEPKTAISDAIIRIYEGQQLVSAPHE